MRLERHLFGSIRGYETLASSAGVSGDESSELSELGFGQSSDPGFLASLNNQICALGRPLRSGRIAITRVFQGPPDDAGRPTLHLRTLVASASDFQRLRSGIESLLHDAAAWDSAAFDSGRAFDWNGRGSSIRASEDVWRLADWAMELQGRRDVVLRVPEDARGEAAVLGLIASVADEDAIRLRWGLRLLSSSAAADVCTMLPSAALSPRRRIVDVPLDGAWRHGALGDARYRAQGMRTFEYMRFMPAPGEGYDLDSVAGGRPPIRRAMASSLSSVAETPSRGRGRFVLAAAAILLMIIGGTIVMTWPRDVGTPHDSSPYTTEFAQVGTSGVGERVVPPMPTDMNEQPAQVPDDVGVSADSAIEGDSPPTTGRKPSTSPPIDPNGGFGIAGDQMLGGAFNGQPGHEVVGQTNPGAAEDGSGDMETRRLEGLRNIPPSPSRDEDPDEAIVPEWDGDVIAAIDRVQGAVVSLTRSVLAADSAINRVKTRLAYQPPGSGTDKKTKAKFEDAISLLCGELKVAWEKVGEKDEDRPGMEQLVNNLLAAFLSSGIDARNHRFDRRWFAIVDGGDLDASVGFSWTLDCDFGGVGDMPSRRIAVGVLADCWARGMQEIDFAAASDCWRRCEILSRKLEELRAAIEIFYNKADAVRKEIDSRASEYNEWAMKWRREGEQDPVASLDYSVATYKAKVHAALRLLEDVGLANNLVALLASGVPREVMDAYRMDLLLKAKDSESPRAIWSALRDVADEVIRDSKTSDQVATEPESGNEPSSDTATAAGNDAPAEREDEW